MELWKSCTWMLGIMITNRTVGLLTWLMEKAVDFNLSEIYGISKVTEFCINDYCNEAYLSWWNGRRWLYNLALCFICGDWVQSFADGLDYLAVRDCHTNEKSVINTLRQIVWRNSNWPCSIQIGQTVLQLLSKTIFCMFWSNNITHESIDIPKDIFFKFPRLLGRFFDSSKKCWSFWDM